LKYVVFAVAAILSSCTRPLVKAHMEEKAGIEAFEKKDYSACIERYDVALAGFGAFAAEHPSPQDQKHWWAMTYLGGAHMARAQCLKGAGRSAEAIAEMEPGIKQLLDGTAGDPQTLESIRQKHREFAANMTEVLAKWKKEAR
jgi:hypothetical protein